MTLTQRGQRAATTQEIAAVYNRNHTKAFEELITNIHINGGEQKVGTVENSFGRNGKTVQVYFNTCHKVWDYV